MKRSFFYFSALILLVTLLLAGCTSQTAAVETPIQPIQLTRPVNISTAEISGLDWYGDWLVFLPQYPARFRRESGTADGALFALPKEEILAYLDGQDEQRLDPQPIAFNDDGLRSMIPGFQGYEAIAFDGETVYLTVEAEPRSGTLGWIVRGRIEPDLSRLVLDASTRQEIPTQTPFLNQSDETILLVDDSVVTIYEANGARVNPEPVAHRFSRDLQPLDSLPLTHLDYRITDATQPDENGRFWVINYFYPGMFWLYRFHEPLFSAYGTGPTHQRYLTVERLVEMQYTPQGIQRVEQPPIQLHLYGNTGRNWEGIVRLDERGFLLVTDKLPDTLFAFVPLESPPAAAVGE